MKQVDYIVVGIGIAGVSFCEQLLAHQKSFVVYDNASQKASLVAGGLYNPVVLKRFKPVWKSKEQLAKALPFYKAIEKRLHIQIDYNIPLYRKFSTLEEQNNWFAASDKPILSDYLSPKIIKNENQQVEAAFGFGEVRGTGRIDTQTLITTYKKDLKDKNLLYQSGFMHDELSIEDDGLQYQDIKARSIVFAEGYGMVHNPFFHHLPLAPAKGELLIIHAPDLNISYTLKAGIFLIPLGKDHYYVGATYEWKDLNHHLSPIAKERLLKKLQKLIHAPFTVVKQVAGIRPTVVDRRPLIGQHHEHDNLFILNGLGTRGVMLGPYAAHALYNLIEHQKPIDPEININRFSLD